MKNVQPLAYLILVAVLLAPNLFQAQSHTYSKTFVDTSNVFINTVASGLVNLDNGNQLVGHKRLWPLLTDGLFETRLLELDQGGEVVTSKTYDNFFMNNFQGLYNHNDSILVIGAPDIIDTVSWHFEVIRLQWGEPGERIIQVQMDSLTSFRSIGSKLYGDTLYLYGTGRVEGEQRTRGVLCRYDLKRDKIVQVITTSRGTRENAISGLAQNSAGEFFVILKFYHFLQLGISPSSGTDILKYSPEGDLVDEYSFDSSGEIPRMEIGEDDDIIFSDHAQLTPDITHNDDGSIYRASDINPVTFSFASSIINDPWTHRGYVIEDIATTKNGDILLAGQSSARDLNELDCNRAHGFMARLTSDGATKWSRIYHVPKHDSIPHQDRCVLGRLFNVEETPTGDIIAYGALWTIRDAPSLPESSYEHGWLLRTDANGCLEGYGCERNITLSQGVDSTRHSMFSPGYEWNILSSLYTPNPRGLAQFTTRYRFSKETELVAGDYYYRLLANTNLSGEDGFTATEYLFKEREGKVYLLDPYRESDLGDIDLLMYDYRAELGDTIDNRTFAIGGPQGELTPQRMIVNQIDTVTLLNGERRKRWVLGCTGLNFNWGPIRMSYIEGMGAQQGLFVPVEDHCYAADYSVSTLVCYSLYGETLHGGYVLSLSPEIFPPDSCYLEIPVSTRDVKGLEYLSVTIVPNPTTGQFRISGLSPVSTRIYTATGQLITTYGPGNEIDASGLPHGLYIVSATDDAGRIGTARVVIGQ